MRELLSIFYLTYNLPGFGHSFRWPEIQPLRRKWAMKRVKVLVLVLAILCMVPNLAQAAGGWVTANVLSVGVGGTFTYIQLSDTAVPPAFASGTYFAADTTGSRSKEMLATGLTAISLAKTCLCWLDDFAPYSNMSAMYLNQ
jgi:hypothetical protein